MPMRGFGVEADKISTAESSMILKLPYWTTVPLSLILHTVSYVRIRPTRGLRVLVYFIDHVIFGFVTVTN